MTGRPRQRLARSGDWVWPGVIEVAELSLAPRITHGLVVAGKPGSVSLAEYDQAAMRHAEQALRFPLRLKQGLV
jgi:hypothetical protein